MARASIREALRLRSSLFSHPALGHSNFGLASSSSHSLSAPSDLGSDNREGKQSLHRRTVNLLERCHNMIQLSHIHAHLITRGLFQDVSLAGRVLKHSADYGDIKYMIFVFQDIESPDAFCINNVIRAYACSNTPHQAVVFYFEMLRDGFVPNTLTFPPLISSCAKTGCLKSGQKCHAQATKRGIDCLVRVQNSLIHLYACCGLINLAGQIFEEMCVRDLVSWNSIVDGFVKVGELGRAHHLFDKMPQRNVISWNIMITGYLNGGNPGCCLKLFREMMKTDLGGSHTTMVSVLTACGRSARLKEGRSVHGYLIKQFPSSSLIIDTALIDTYSKCRRVDAAKLVFDRMSARNLVCWNAMILGHCLHGNPADGLNLYEKMINEACSNDLNPNEGAGSSPDEITFVGVLCACARSRMLTEGRKYFNQMLDLFNIQPNFGHYWCMASLFAGVGLVEEALETIRNMPVNKNMSSESLLWARLLGSCRFEGNVILGEEIAKALIELEPNNPSCYVLLLNIYAVSGQWEEVARIKQTMKEKRMKEIAGFSLFDLKDFVHNLKLKDIVQQHMEEVNIMMAELSQRLSMLSPNSKRETGS
ncbi:hypothetical protein NMG60_11007815 [Bertholletia excelsa]